MAAKGQIERLLPPRLNGSCRFPKAVPGCRRLTTRTFETGSKGVRAWASPESVVRNSVWAATRASSVKFLLRPLGLGRIRAVVPANFLGNRRSVEKWLPDHRRHRALAEKGDRARGIAPNPGFEFCSGRFEFFQRHFIRPLGRPANNGGDTAAIVEQAPLFMGPEAARR
jgi:hypothetical protein